MEPVLKKQQAAEHLQVTVRTLEAWMRRGLIPYLKIGKTVRIRMSAVDAMLSERHEVRRRSRFR
jgi:excisionase family DNA binding protein